jgi:malate synthase
MNSRIKTAELQVASALYSFVNEEALPGTGVEADEFWSGLSRIVSDLAPRNLELLKDRDRLQSEIDHWYRSSSEEEPVSVDDYQKFLTDIGYLVPEREDFSITTKNVDAEIASIAGPQLVVPVSNARFALNAANARWGSLFDAYYGTDVIDEANGREKREEYNPLRGREVVTLGQEFLDKALPLARKRHSQVRDYCLIDGETGKELRIELEDGSKTELRHPERFVGFKRTQAGVNLLFRNNSLHFEIQVDRTHPVGATTLSGIKDIVIESAISTIQDCEDSVAAVDAEDKTQVYRNWLGLMKGNLVADFDKGGQTMTRTLKSDRYYTDCNGEELRLHGRSLLLVRNVGHLMTTDAVLDREGREIPEGILDAMVTVLCAMHDLKGESEFRNSRTGSVYIVKPKMHGPDEVTFTNDLFSLVEDAFRLPRFTLKVGVMDEERRTSVNLKECIRAVRDRLVFINTGFLDRTGDEIHTCMEAGAVVPKSEMKSQPWLSAYEDRNVDLGIRCGLIGKAQIGKGMWPKPDDMAQMVETKGEHPKAGANCAWVPSPTAATLHATHYHQTDVSATQLELAKRKLQDLEKILMPPLVAANDLETGQIKAELDNNIQGILGYVVRWVDQGVGCSKVPDIDNVGLMEDRATLRISSQHVANWLRHGICSKNQVRESLERMAEIVDRQNSGDSSYRCMAPNYDENVAFQAACDLIFEGSRQPNGYTEPVLHARRREAKTKYGC